MRETLSSGILALIPTSKLPHSFIERLSSAMFKVFLDLIARFYPDAIKFSQLIEHLMQNALIGRQPPHSLLPIEHLSDNQLQEIHLSDLVQLFERYATPTIEDISPPPIKHVSSSPVEHIS